jgi:hypothetical protein
MIVSLAYSAVIIGIALLVAFLLGAAGLCIGTLIGTALCCYFDPKGLSR